MPARSRVLPTPQQAAARLPLLQALQGTVQDAFLRAARVQACKTGQVVLEQGAPPEGVMWVVEGRLKVALLHEDGRVSLLAILGPGDMLGELGVLGASARSAHVEALEPAVVLHVPAATFLRCMEQSAPLSLAVCRMLARRVRMMGEHVQLLAGAQAQARVAKKLLVLVERFGREGKDGVTLELPLSQSDLAALADLSRQRTNQLLQEFVGQGVLAKKGRAWLVLDLPALQALAAG